MRCPRCSGSVIWTWEGQIIRWFCLSCGRTIAEMPIIRDDHKRPSLAILKVTK